MRYSSSRLQAEFRPSTFPSPATTPSARPQRREPQHKTSRAGRRWLCRILSWEQEMPKSGFGPRTAALYVGRVVPATGKGLQGPPIPAPAVLKSPPRSLGLLGASHSTPQSCRALTRKVSLCSPLLLSQRLRFRRAMTRAENCTGDMAVPSTHCSPAPPCWDEQPSAPWDRPG